ncbi:MAG: hypothetical protein K0U66_10010 [Gammaproteobacteria bacterium]|nr:hypothetical protein [Gammaproteobacteria bacterium]
MTTPQEVALSFKPLQQQHTDHRIQQHINRMAITGAFSPQHMFYQVGRLGNRAVFILYGGISCIRRGPNTPQRMQVALTITSIDHQLIVQVIPMPKRLCIEDDH